MQLKAASSCQAPFLAESTLTEIVYELYYVDQDSIHIFGLKAINKVSLFHRYGNGPIVAFMKNRSDFFILFQFCQKFNFIVEFVAFGPA